MRPALAAVALAILAACQPAAQSGRPGSVQGPPDFTLDAEGIQPDFTSLRIDFGRTQTGVIDAVARLVGAGPRSVITNFECRSGALTQATWANGLTLNFRDGGFRGWSMSGDAVPAAGGLRVGLAGAELGPAQFTGTGPGLEFRKGGVFGLMTADGEAVRLLWSGETCMRR